MYKLLLISLIFYITFIPKAYPQSTLITGTVVNNHNSAVGGANVTVKDTSNVVFITATDSTGTFKIPSAYYKTGYTIKINALGYNLISVNKYIDLNLLKKESVNIGTIKLTVFAHQLKEVFIKSSRRYRDTTKIDLSNKNFQRSVMIDDLFSQNGFSKGPDGQLFYKGKAVSDIQVNGGTFFGKNNTDIYHLLPALILNGIEVIQTNVDSTTNTTTLQPTIKINLQLKDKYNKGAFGNANLGAGTSQRYLANTSLYAYKKDEQVSVAVNSNNTNLNQYFLLSPTISFSANGNNLVDNMLKFSYRNVYQKKIELNFETTGDIGHRTYLSESNTQFKTKDEFSSVNNYSQSRFSDLKDTKLTLDYKIDTLNTLHFGETFGYEHSKQTDSLNYKTAFADENTLSDLNKLLNTANSSLESELQYDRVFSGKKRKLLQVKLGFGHNIYNVNETDSALYSYNFIPQNYFIDGRRSVKQSVLDAAFSFTDPIGENGYIKFAAGYKNDGLNYNPVLISDTLKFADNPAQVTNNFKRSDIIFQKTFTNFSFTGTAAAILDNEKIRSQSNAEPTFFNANIDLQGDYKISSKKNLTISLLTDTHYPTVDQLTSINNSFDLVSQTEGNLYLKPELVKTARINYFNSISDSVTMTLLGTFTHYDSRFGFDIINGPDNIQYQTIENLGSSNAAGISFSLNKTMKGRSLSYYSSLSYGENPEIILNSKTLNNSITFDQNFSLPITISNIVSVSPALATSYIKYYYENSSTNAFTFTYSDKVSINVLKLQLDLFPLLNYNHSIGHSASWSMNGEIKKSFLKDYGFIWLQAYDIFNSFKFINNLFGPDYIQTVKYSNVERYLILGISLKFNNMK